MSNLVTTAEAAKALGVDVSTLHRWRVDPDCPRPEIEQPRFLLWDKRLILRFGVKKLQHRRRELPLSKHGRAGYNKGCRCAICTEANARYMADYRAKKATAL